MSTKTLSLLRRTQSVGDSLILLFLLILAWQGVHQFVGDTAMSSPVKTLSQSLALLFDYEFWPNVWATFKPFLIALAIEIVTGLLFGVLLGIHRPSGAVMEPLLVGFYAIPKVLFYPVISLSFGIGVTAEVVFAYIHGIFPITLFTMNAVRTIRPVYMKTARSLRLSLAQRIWYIALPATLPEVFTGVRIGFATTLLSVLIMEMFGSKNGLGFILMRAMAVNRVEEIMSVAFLLAAFAVGTSLILIAIDRRLHKRL